MWVVYSYSSADSEVVALQENQDCYLLQLDRPDEWCVMGVFDGHGVYGGKVSSHVRNAFAEVLGSMDGRRVGQDPRKVETAFFGGCRRPLQRVKMASLDLCKVLLFTWSPQQEVVCKGCTQRGAQHCERAQDGTTNPEPCQTGAPHGIGLRCASWQEGEHLCMSCVLLRAGQP